MKPDRTLYTIAEQWDLHPTTILRYARALGMMDDAVPGRAQWLTYSEQVELERALRSRPQPGRRVVNDGPCKLSHCHAPAHTRGWCKYHYEHYRTYGHPTQKRRRYECAECGEMRDRKARGMCGRCYKRWRRTNATA